ncbi:MAG TPA: D-aminoacylase [Steroidobacteraceae bacterium]|nr:D-aminoacylase [Steroidobacteraceae bacterium]
MILPRAAAASIRAAIALLAALGGSLAAAPRATAAEESYDLVIRGGMVYDGSGAAPFVGDVAIRGDRIAYVGPHAPASAARELDARGKAVSPGFVNMLAHPEVSLLADGRALSDLVQGVTLEVLGEDSMGPWSAQMKRLALSRQGDIRYDVDWTTLGEYLARLERRGISVNVASYVGAGTVRTYVLGERDVQPTPGQLDEMRTLVRAAMEQGALGVTTALIYAPNEYARTPELIALASESARCGGIYSVHMRSEGDRLLEALKETIEIARESGAPAEIYHLKAAGRRNWGKLDALIRAVDAARASGLRITADMYVYTAGATGLDAAMPPWVQDGGLEEWIARLKDPAIRARVLADMRDPAPAWENLYGAAGAAGTLLLGFKNPSLKPLTGKTLAAVARSRGVSPEDAAIDLVIEDGSRVDVAYFLMSEENVRREVALPWVNFDSDADAPAPEGVFLKSSRHPRTYGNFARVLAHYVREEKVLTLQQAIHKLTALPAATLSLKDRGILKAGDFADVVVFDPATIQDHATYEHPQQLATGVLDVWVNGVEALRDGVATGAASGRAVRGRAWTGAPGGGCRARAADWTWSP